MGKPWLCAVCVIVLFAACNRGPQAPFDENDEVVIHGVYLDDSGSPYDEQWVGFWINSPESFFTNFMGLDPEENDRTDSTGIYSETFMGGDLMDAQGATYQVAAMNYDPDWPDTAPAVACFFYPLAIDILLDTLMLWRGNPIVSFQSDSFVDHAVFSWAKISSTHGAEPDTYYFQVKATQDGPNYTMWQQTMGSDTSFTLPTYVLPSVYARKWRVIASYLPESESDFGYGYFTDPDTTQITADTLHRLLSLGKNCRAEAYSQSFTTATDGKWGPWPTYTVSFAATNISWVYVDLSDTTHSVNALAIYDMTIAGSPATAGYEVYVSNDTLNWGTEVATNSQRAGYFYVDGFSKQGRYVKLEARDGTIGITGFREVCVFGQ
jgi:hypothetical protein